MLASLPIGIMVFPGTGIQANLANKAKKLGIPVFVRIVSLNFLRLLSPSPIEGILSVRLAVHEAEFHRWASAVQPGYSRNCRTSTATPAEPEDLPSLLAEPGQIVCCFR
jgi:hypothetical protein